MDRILEEPSLEKERSGEGGGGYTSRDRGNACTAAGLVDELQMEDGDGRVSSLSASGLGSGRCRL